MKIFQIKVVLWLCKTIIWEALKKPEVLFNSVKHLNLIWHLFVATYTVCALEADDYKLRMLWYLLTGMLITGYNNDTKDGYRGLTSFQQVKINNSNENKRLLLNKLKIFQKQQDSVIYCYIKKCCCYYFINWRKKQHEIKKEQIPKSVKCDLSRYIFLSSIFANSNLQSI